MSARRKFIIYSLKCIILLFSLYILHSTFYTNVYAASQGDTCDYNEERPDGIYTCHGSQQPFEGDNNHLTCQYDGAIDPACVKQPTPTANPTTAPVSVQDPCRDAGGCPISKSNFSAPEQSNYYTTNLLNTALEMLGGCSPITHDGGLNYILNSNNKVELARVPCNPGGGATSQLTNFMVAMYSSPPTSTTHYLANLGENFGVKNTYAQNVGGSGEGIIKPIYALWQVVRNIAYLAFTIVFVVVGLMIMFRAKINAQTVVSIQQALPGLVIGLIMVTFSYFLSALLIDTSFVSIQILGHIFEQVDTQKVLGDPVGNANDSNVFKLFLQSIRLKENIGDVTGGAFSTLSSIGGGGIGGVGTAILLPAIIGAIIGAVIFWPATGLAAFAGFGAAGLGGFTGGAIGGGLLGAGASVIIGLIVPLILMIALFIQFFRLLWQLISSYIALLVSTVTAPLIILASSVPGRGATMEVWWRSVLGNALVFPAVFAAFMFAGMILGTETGSFNGAPPLFGGLSTQLLRLIIAYGIILGTPAIPDMIRRALGVPNLGAIPQAALGGFQAGRGSLQAGYQAGTAGIAREREEAFSQRYRSALGVPGAVNPVMRWIYRLPGLGRR